MTPCPAPVGGLSPSCSRRLRHLRSGSRNRPRRQTVIALALGGGAAKGLRPHRRHQGAGSAGHRPDIVVGTSAGSVVGAMYAAGKNGFELQSLAITLDESQVSDWSLPDRGVVRVKRSPPSSTRPSPTPRSRNCRKIRRRRHRPCQRRADRLPQWRHRHRRARSSSVSPASSSRLPSVAANTSMAASSARSRPFRAGDGRHLRDRRRHLEQAAASKTKSSLDILMQTFAIMGRA